MTKLCQKSTRRATENKNEAELPDSQMKSNPTVDEMAEVLSITDKGFWIRVYSKEYFRRKRLGKKPKEYFVSFEFHPHFLGATEEEIRQIKISGYFGYVSWETLQTGFELCNIGKLKRGRYHGFTKQQLERLKKYNDDQIAKGGTPWLDDRLLDFPYWKELEKHGKDKSKK